MDDIRNLMSKIAAGDKNALKSLIELCGGGIKTAAYRVLKDNALCDDVLNGIIYKIWENADKIKHLKNINGYIFTMAYNKAIDIKRKQKDIFFDDEKLNVLSQTKEQNDEKFHIDETLQKMDDNLRSVLLLKAVCGYNFFEIAKIKNITYKKARNMYINACNIFKKMYEE